MYSSLETKVTSFILIDSISGKEKHVCKLMYKYKCSKGTCKWYWKIIYIFKFYISILNLNIIHLYLNINEFENSLIQMLQEK